MALSASTVGVWRVATLMKSSPEGAQRWRLSLPNLARAFRPCGRGRPWRIRPCSGGAQLQKAGPRNDIRNCALIRSKTAPTKPEWMSGFCDAHREPQDRARPAGWQSRLGILPKPPENTNSVPQRPRDDAEHAQGSARRPSTQSHQLPPARASSIGAARCWLGTTPTEGRSERHTTGP